MRAGRGRALAGREAGQKIFYLSTAASDPATLERATFIPALQKAPFLGGDDFLGAARERAFLFTNGQTGRDNPEAQGLSHLITDGQAVEDANLSNNKLLDTLANHDGDTLNGEWSEKAVREKLNKRQDDENEILNLAAQRLDLLTGPLGAPYGAGGFVINCPTVAFTEEEPVVDHVAPVPGAQA